MRDGEGEGVEARGRRAGGGQGRNPEATEGRLFGRARRRGLCIVRGGILKAEICRRSFTPSTEAIAFPQDNRTNNLTTRLKLFKPTEAIIVAEGRRKDSFNALFSEDSRAAKSNAYCYLLSPQSLMTLRGPNLAEREPKAHTGLRSGVAACAPVAKSRAPTKWAPKAARSAAFSAAAPLPPRDFAHARSALCDYSAVKCRSTHASRGREAAFI